MSNFRTPISKPEDAPQDFQDGLNMGNVSAKRLVPEAKNYADDINMVHRAKMEIYPLVRQARDDRKVVEGTWQELQRMELMRHDSNQKYKGRSNAYLPIHAKNLQTQATTFVKGMFPSDEYVDAVCSDADKEKGLKAKHYMQYQFERVAFLRMYMKLFSRQLLNYGFSVLKFWYRQPGGYAKARTIKTQDQALQAAYAPDFQRDSADQGLTVSARSIFNFYAYPFTAETLRETTLQFEDIRMSMAELVYWGKREGWANEAQWGQAPDPQSVQTNTGENFSVHDVPAQNDQQTGTKLGDTRMVTEVYSFMELPSSEYTDQDMKGCPLPVRIIFLGEEPVHIQRNSSYHQSSPFLGLSTNASPGFLLGYGSGKMIAPLQYLANDFTNQTNDVCIYGLNPGVKVVPGMVVGQLRPMAPGVTWYVNQLDAVEFFHPPTEQVGVGMAMISQILSMAQDFGGAPPIMQGTNSKGGGKTATGSQLLQSNAMAPMQDLVEDCETEILVPLATKAWSLAQQYAPQQMMAEVFGVMKEIKKDDLMFDAKWRWMASSQAANAQMRAYQTINFLQALMPVLPVLAQQGVKVNLVPLFRRIYTDALGNRGFGEVFKEGAMPPMPGMLPGGGPPEGGVPPPRSPAESANGGSLPIQAGEDGAFGEVRQESDIMSALMGAAEGGGQYEP